MAYLMPYLDAWLGLDNDENFDLQAAVGLRASVALRF
jgi:hypothetical protein